MNLEVRPTTGDVNSQPYFQTAEHFFRSELSDTSITTNLEGRLAPFQRWYKFKEAFSPSLVLEQIQACSKKPSVIVDPFGGSGTSALIASSLGIECSTIEVNPFLSDLIEAKLTNYDPQSAILAFTEVLAFADLDKGKALKRYEASLPPTFVETADKERWLFNRDIASRILAFRSAIDGLGVCPEATLLTVLLGACLVDASNIVISGKGRRYRRNWQNRKTFSYNLDVAFQGKVSTAVEDIAKSQGLKRSRPTVISGDSRDKVSLLPENIDLALFSPPYPNSFDYTDIYNIELWMLGYFKVSDDNRTLRNSTLRSHVQIKRDYGKPPVGSPLLDDVLNQLRNAKSELWSKWIPDMVGAYFGDLFKITSTIGQKLSESGRIVMVVGDSRYAGIHIPVADILAELATNDGLTVLSKHSARSMRSSPQQGGSHVLAESLITITT